MNKITDKDATILAKEKTYEIDYNAKDIFKRGANYLDELASKNFFLDAIKNYINKGTSSFKGDIDNLNDINDFIKVAYDNAGFKGDKGSGAFSYNPSSLKSWIDGKVLPTVEKAQKMCMCLGMSADEAIEFIFKGCLAKPFNFKNIWDSVCYYCLNNGKSFADAQRIMNEIEKANIQPEQYPENDTIKIGEQIKSKTNDDDLIRYLSANKKGFAEQNQGALDTLKRLVKDSVELAEWERKEIFHDTAESEIKSEKDIPSILSVILGYDARATQVEKVGDEYQRRDIYKKKISKSNFPNLIKNDFPQPQQLQNILNGKKTSAEAIRKAIILFTFYNMFTKLKKDGSDNSKVNCFDIYSDTIDDILCECGYIEMYWKHPYDWMFGYCAGATDPVGELRELIAAFYLDLEDIY